MADDTATTVHEAPAPAARFEGRRGPLAWLLLRNLLLSVLTLGIYRFWGRTHVRRYVWRQTVVLDDALEYLGTGGELLIGFLIAAAVLLPMLGVYYVLQFLYADESEYALTALEVLYYLVLFFLIQIAIHRMRRYRLTRTAWRGVRFGLGGSSLRYACIAFGYGLLTVATLGLAYPWMRVATFRYFANHARFGEAPVRLSARAGPLFRYWISIYGVVAIGVAFVAFDSWPALQWLFELGFYRGFDGDSTYKGEPIGLIKLMFPAGFTILLVVQYKTAEFRHLTSNIAIGDSEFVSRFLTEKAIKIYFIYIALILCALLSAILLFLFLWELESGNSKGISSLMYASISMIIMFFLTWKASKYSETRWYWVSGRKGRKRIRGFSRFFLSIGFIAIPLIFYISYLGDYMDAAILRATSATGVSALVVILLFLIFRNFVKTIVLELLLLKHACETLGISNAEALDEVAQSFAAVPSYGEATAEALDVGGF